MTRLAVSCLWLMTLALLDAAQEPTFRASTELVRVDVLATQRGRPVRDLTIGDFEVRDQGVVQPLEFMRFEQLPLNIVVVCDMSGSITAREVDNIRGAVEHALTGLKKGDRVAMVTFGRKVTQQIALTEDAAAVRAALRALKPEGLTALIDGLYAGVALTANEPGRSIVLVFSDGLDTASWLTTSRVLDSVKSSDTTVYSVSLAKGKDKFLAAAAEASGGRHLDLDSSGALQTAFAGFLDEFRQRYVIGYTPTGIPHDGWHRLEVKVRRNGVEAKTRPGYLVLK